MHEAPVLALTHLADSGAGSGVATTLIVVGGSVVTGAFGLIIAAIQRDRAPRSTVPSNDNDTASQYGLLTVAFSGLRADHTALQAEHAALQGELDTCETQRDLFKHKLSMLRSAVRRRNLDPDTLIAAEEAQQ